MAKYALTLTLLSFTFSGCHKILDYYNYKDNDTPTGCQVKTITNTSGEFITTTHIRYHGNGLPNTVTYVNYDGAFDLTDSFTFHYAYDHLNRLESETSEWVYGPSLVYYAYEGSSRWPVRDTIRDLYVSFVEDLEYDDNGRIIKNTRRDFQFVIPEDNPGPHLPQVYQYYYDVRGNRQEHPSNPGYKGVIQYGDKPSLYSLHPVWQLIHKNYSKNSVPYGETYNSKGLPLTIKQDNVASFQPFLSLHFGSAITYECK